MAKIAKPSLVAMILGLSLLSIKSSPTLCAVSDSSGTIAGHQISSRYNMKDLGVTDSFVDTLFEDREGRIWAGGRFGRALYKGKHQWEVDVTDPATWVKSGGVRCIAQSNDGKLWFVPFEVEIPFGAGLKCFDGVRWNKIDGSNSPLRELEFGTHRVSAVFTGRDKLWFGISDALLSYTGGDWLPKIWLSSLLRLHAAVAIDAGIESRQGYVWVAAGSNGILRIDIAKMRATVFNPIEKARFPHGSPDESSRRDATSVSCMYEDRSGRIWVGADGFVYAYDSKGDSWRNWNLVETLLPRTGVAGEIDRVTGRHVQVSSIYQDRAGRMLFGTSRGLLALVDSETRFESYTAENSLLRSDVISTIMEDKKGRIWIGGGEIIVLE